MTTFLHRSSTRIIGHVAFCLTFCLTLCAPLFLACNKEDPKTLQTQSAQAVDSSKTKQRLAFTLDTAKSRVIWEGSEGLARIKETHVGTFNFERGSLTAGEGSLTGGTFVIDIRSLKNTDIKSARLRLQQETHLKSADFFDAEKFPTATFDVILFQLYFYYFAFYLFISDYH